MSGKLRFRFDAARAEPLLRELAQCNDPETISKALVDNLQSWAGVALCRVWAPGMVHVPFGLARLEAVSRSGTSIHVADGLLQSRVLAQAKTHPRWIEEDKIRGLGAHPWGDAPPYGVILVLTRVPLAEDAFAWLGRIAAHAGIAHRRGSTEPRILTAPELKDLERDNLLRALEATGGKVFGPDGAAALLGLKPTTLASKLKALKVPSPRDQGKSPKPLRGNRYPESR